MSQTLNNAEQSTATAESNPDKTGLNLENQQILTNQIAELKKTLKNLSKNDLIKLVIENIYVLNVLQANVRAMQTQIEYIPPAIEGESAKTEDKKEEVPNA